MMGDNAYDEISTLRFTACFKDGVTKLGDCYCTAPFKIAKPFYDNEMMKIVVMSASAGLMSGDIQKFDINVETNCKLYFTTQSYEKIHKMDNGFARRQARIKVGKEANLYYIPLCTIPFAKSSFKGDTEIWLENSSSKLFLAEVFAPGRKAHGELFKYDKYISRTLVWRSESLIYHDNTRYIPEKMKLDSYGMFEKWSHLLNVFIAGFTDTNKLIEDIREYVRVKGLEGGASTTAYGDISVKVLGDNAQALEDIVMKIGELIQCI